MKTEGVKKRVGGNVVGKRSIADFFFVFYAQLLFFNSTRLFSTEKVQRVENEFSLITTK